MCVCVCIYVCVCVCVCVCVRVCACVLNISITKHKLRSFLQILDDIVDNGEHCGFVIGCFHC